jgi:hypothetical protein
MKPLRLLAAFALLLGINTASAEIDLSPIPSVRELEGCKFAQIEFRDNGERITYEMPRGWTYQARDKYTLALVPPNKDLVSVKIKFIPTPGTLVLDEAQLKYLKDTASSLLPADSKLSAEPVITPNPLRINDHPTCEIVVTFELHAQRLRMSVLFVDLGQSQLRFSLISRPDDFEPLHKLFQDSWFSWQWAGKAEAPSEGT